MWTKEYVYSLGFVWADGYLYQKERLFSKVIIEIVKDDFDVLLPIFRKYHKGSDVYRHRPNRRPQGCFVFSDKKHFAQLAQWNYLNKNCQCPSTILFNSIPQPLLHYWWRGYVDGDGCFYYNKKQYLRQFHIGSSYQQDWQHVVDLFNQLNIEPYNIQRRHPNQNKHASSVIRIARKDAINNLYNFLYPKCLFDGIGLRRKYDKCTQMLQ